MLTEDYLECDGCRCRCSPLVELPDLPGAGHKVRTPLLLFPARGRAGPGPPSRSSPSRRIRARLSVAMQNNLQKEHLYKILVIGDLGVGKTSIIKRYVHHNFSPNYRATIGVDFALKVLNWDQETVRLQLWDIAGTVQPLFLYKLDNSGH